jgi:hemerythrin-like metal-binding protein
MTWSDNFSVGVKAMDDQHKGLVSTLNELHAAMRDGKDKAVTGKLLSSLVRYTHDHFNAEEAMMTRTKYPKCAPHFAHHKDLTGQVQQFVERYERGEITLNIDHNKFDTFIGKSLGNYGEWSELEMSLIKSICL